MRQGSMESLKGPLREDGTALITRHFAPEAGMEYLNDGVAYEFLQKTIKK